MSIAQRLAAGRVLVVLAFAAFALRSLLPLGYMLERRDGLATVVICTSQGAREAWLDLATGKLAESGGETEPNSKSKHEPCAFAFAAAALCPPSPLPLPLPPPALAGEASGRRSASALCAFFAGPPLPARGPPSAV